MNNVYRIIQRRKIWYSLSIIIIIIGAVFIALGGLKLGVDFTGGSLMQISFADDRPAMSEITNVFSGQNVENVRMQTLGELSYNIRFAEVDSQKHQEIQLALKEKFNDYREESFEVIGPVIGQEVTNRAITSISLVLLGIIIYIMWAFRSATSEFSSWMFGINAVIALLHDIAITIGIFAALGYFFGIEINVLFVTALLTILGFSVHDTIVVFDRIRESLKVQSGTLEEIANYSVNQTIVRSVNTTSTTLLVLLALFIFGGNSIHYFVLALIIGMIAGTYSSIFIASPLLISLSGLKKR
ncbi:protein translocase subunit SecF [Patescibacteria group bacterium]